LDQQQQHQVAGHRPQHYTARQLIRGGGIESSDRSPARSRAIRRSNVQARPAAQLQENHWEILAAGFRPPGWDANLGPGSRISPGSMAAQGGGKGMGHDSIVIDGWGPPPAAPERQAPPPFPGQPTDVSSLQSRVSPRPCVAIKAKNGLEPSGARQGTIKPASDVRKRTCSRSSGTGAGGVLPSSQAWP